VVYFKNLLQGNSGSKKVYHQCGALHAQWNHILKWKPVQYRILKISIVLKNLIAKVTLGQSLHLKTLDFLWMQNVWSLSSLFSLKLCNRKKIIIQFNVKLKNNWSHTCWHCPHLKGFFLSAFLTGLSFWLWLLSTSGFIWATAAVRWLW
jgi:hypothetical protein